MCASLTRAPFRDAQPVFQYREPFIKAGLNVASVAGIAGACIFIKQFASQSLRAVSFRVIRSFGRTIETIFRPSTKFYRGIITPLVL